MDYLGKKLLGMAGIQRAHMQTTQDHHHHDNHSKHARHDDPRHPNPDHKAKVERYTGVPAIPTDIGYNSGKASGGSHSTGFFANAAGNPAVIIGMGLTTIALLGMIRKSVLGDKLGTQKYMQYRIMAQFFTVTALVAGVTIFAGVGSNDKKEDKPVVVATNSAN